MPPSQVRAYKLDAGDVSGLNMIATRLSPGVISESSSSHLPPSVGSKLAKPVMFPPGRSSRATMPAGDGVGRARKDDRYRPRLPLEGDGRRGPACYDDVGLQADQLLRERSCPSGVITVPTKVHPYVAASGPTKVCKRLGERGDASLRHGIVFLERHKHANAPYAVALLCARCHRPDRRACQTCD